jgi:hypothetical protein
MERVRDHPLRVLRVKISSSSPDGAKGRIEANEMEKTFHELNE